VHRRYSTALDSNLRLGINFLMGCYADSPCVADSFAIEAERLVAEWKSRHAIPQ
jgi:hypothetical protein